MMTMRRVAPVSSKLFRALKGGRIEYPVSSIQDRAGGRSGLEHPDFEIRDFGLVRRRSDGTGKNLTGSTRVDNLINPQSGRCIPRVHRSLVPSLDLSKALRLFLFGNVFAAIL